jgi:hypothetical protein
MARATGKELTLLKRLYIFYKEDENRYAGKLLPQDTPGLTECLEAGWIAPSKDVPGKYRITADGALELRFAGEEVDDEHNGT